MPTPCPVWFCHARHLRFSHAVQTRTVQLAEIAAHYLGPRLDSAVRAVPDHMDEGPWMDDLEDGVVWLSVGVAGVLRAPAMARLAERNRAVIVDWMTGAPTGAGLELIDRHVFASLGAYRAARGAMPEAPFGYVAACPDLRLPRGRTAPMDRLRGFWPGDPAPLKDRPQLAARLEAPVPGELYGDVLTRLSGFNLHVLAGESAAAHAPLTGVFAAAAVKAAVLVDRTRNDAVDYLGSSYPFLAEDGSEEASLAMLDYIETVFGGTIWRSALERMHNVAERSSPGMVASDLDRIFGETVGIRFGQSDAA